MPILKWELTKEDDELVDQIADRYIELAMKHGLEPNKGRLIMDLTCCHLNGTPLELKPMLEGSDMDLAHDVSGIQRHINRHTGELEDCFLPRFAVKS